MKPKQIALLVIIIIFADCCKKDNTTIPEVETYSPKYIASYSATVGCRVISDGGSDILECGIYIGF